MSTESSDTKTPSKALPKPPHPYHKLSFSKPLVVVHQRWVNTVIRGRLKWFRSGVLKLTEATVTGGAPGGHFVATVPWLMVDIQTIALLYPDSEVKDEPPEA